ncbi:MAG: hypothetical protein AB3X37_10745 [Leptothrix ochracea]
MFTFRATQKLLNRINAQPVLETTLPDTMLGEWYANLVWAWTNSGRAGR